MYTCMCNLVPMLYSGKKKKKKQINRLFRVQIETLKKLVGIGG